MDPVSSILLRIGHLAIPSILPVSMRNSSIPLLRQIFDAIFVIFSHFESILMIFRSDYLIFTYRISLSSKSVSRYFPVIISSQIMVKNGWNGYNGHGNHYRITITWRAKSKFSGFQTFWSNIIVQAIFRVCKQGFRAFLSWFRAIHHNRSTRIMHKWLLWLYNDNQPLWFDNHDQSIWLRNYSHFELLLKKIESIY